MHDRRPAVIVRPATPDAVVAALSFARRHDLRIAVRGGGHSIPGFGVVDDGMVIDLSALGSVRVDPGARRATVGGGALLADVDRATQRHGLVVPAGVVSHTGVGGLTLGGGVGRLMRRFGLTVDSLVSAQVVLADGRIVRAAADEHPDLFWGLRGGGGNFGVVTSFEFRLHPLSEITILRCLHGLDQMRPLLRRAQEVIGGGAPDELLWTSFVRRAHPAPWVPDDLVGQPAVLSHIEWSGERAEGLATLGRLQAELDPRAGVVEVVPFTDIQRQDDELFHHGLHSYIKASFTDVLSAELADAVADRARTLSSPLTQIELLSLGGAMHRVPTADSAFAHRDAQWLVNILATWDGSTGTDTEIGWTRGTHRALAPLTTGGAYVNFMDQDEGSSEWTAYGPTLDRLRRVKAAYDPDNVFRLNQNIQPAGR